MVQTSEKYKVNFALGLTKSLFMLYCLIENSKNSNLEVFNYKIYVGSKMKSLRTYPCHMH
jgi:hypothetical protein